MQVGEIMEMWKAKVSSYNKQQGRKKVLKSEIRLLKGHPFSNEDKVTVVVSEDLTRYIDSKDKKISELEANLEALKNTNNQLNIEVKEALKKLTVATDIIGKQKDIINYQDTVLAIYMNRGVLSRLRNPIPKELKTLEENKQKLVELEDNRPLIIELSEGKKDKKE